MLTRFTDQIVQRVAPYLRQTTPVDILDLWPGSGLWSSKINDFLRPRRHVLVEPDLDIWGEFLHPLTESKPCYKLLPMDIYPSAGLHKTKIDWGAVIKENFPEQSLPSQSSAGLPRNDTLLVLANPPQASSGKDHMTPGRWWIKFLETCLQKHDLHSYGSVRIIAQLPHTEITTVLPRAIAERKRSGLLTETLALHCVELARPEMPEPQYTWRDYNETVKNRERVSERAAAQGIVTPPDRQLPPLEYVPPTPERALGRASRRKDTQPYIHRRLLESHKPLLDDIAKGDLILGERPDKKKANPAKIKARNAAITTLDRENTSAYYRLKFANRQLEIDELTRKFARAAADVNETPERLKGLEGDIVSLQSIQNAEISEIHFVKKRYYDRVMDDARNVALSNNFDNSVLLWERRPFEPLFIPPSNVYPHDYPRGVVYFEAQPNPPVVQKISEMPNVDTTEFLSRFQALSAPFHPSVSMSVSELLSILLPGRSINEIVQAIPSLTAFADRRLKPGCGPMALPDPSADPAFSYQANLDYDLSGVRVRSLSTTTLFEVMVEFEKSSPRTSTLQFNRMLGGTLTSFQSGIENIQLH
jgi:transcription factor 1